MSKKKLFTNEFNEFLQKQRDNDLQLLKEFFADFNAHCLISKVETKKIREDFEKAILYYVKNGVSLEEALELLDTKYLGGFYARSSALWFALDDAAKVYPLSMEHGRMSVFRLSVYLKEQINPILLQMALNFTIKRFPSFATTLKKGVFWHYLDTTKRHFCIEPENDMPCQPLKVSHSGSQSFRVLYFNNRISVEFFHVLTDGSGGLTFLKVLTAEYLRLKGVKITKDDSLWDVNAIPSSEEFENAFSKAPQSKNASGFVDKAALQMNGKLAKVKPCRIIHFKMSVDSLKTAAKKYNCTVSGYLLACMFIATKAATDNFRGEISIQVPVDMRKFYPSKTVRNFSMYCGVRVPINDIEDINSVIERITNQLKEKTSQESMTKMITATEKMVNGIKLIPLVIKQPVTKIIYGFLGDNIFTNTLSNLNVVNIPEDMASHVESMDFVLGTAITNRVSCGLVTVNGVSTFSITKMTIDPTFEEKMHSLLVADGVEMSVEGSGLYED